MTVRDRHRDRVRDRVPLSPSDRTAVVGRFTSARDGWTWMDFGGKDFGELHAKRSKMTGVPFRFADDSIEYN